MFSGVEDCCCGGDDAVADLVRESVGAEPALQVASRVALETAPRVKSRPSASSPGGNPRPFLNMAQHNPFGNGSTPRLQRPGECARDVVENAPKPTSKVKLKVRCPSLSRYSLHGNDLSSPAPDFARFWRAVRTPRRPWLVWVDRRFNTANLSWRLSVGRSTQGPMDRPSFLLFVRAVLPERVPRPCLGGPARVVVRSHKPLAVLAFAVQNGRSWS